MPHLGDQPAPQREKAAQCRGVTGGRGDLDQVVEGRDKTGIERHRPLEGPPGHGPGIGVVDLVAEVIERVAVFLVGLGIVGASCTRRSAD